MIESRENIKNRMLKTASRVWGLPGVEDETSFDPLVEMLINACSAEIEKISGDVHISQARLLQRLAQILAPDTEVGAMPAHTILCAAPSEAEIFVSEEQKFVLFKKNSNSENSKDIFFSPTARFKLFDGAVRFIVAKDTIYEITENRYKEIYATSQNSKSISPNTLLIGVLFDKKIENIKDLSLYFDIKNETKKDLFYHYLKLSKWKINGNETQVLPGYASDISGESLDVNAVLTKNYRRSDNASKNINQFYERRFVNIKNIESTASKLKKYPEGMEGVFDEKILEKLSQEILWLEVKFSEIIPGDLLKDVSISTNCFPAFNRRLNQLTYRLEPSLNIIPLKSEEFFFDIKSVSDTDRVKYHIKSTDGKLEINDGDILLRTSGVGRFDSREASELLQHLAEALRDESASFSIFGGHSISNSIAELNKAISNLEDKVAKVSLEESISYIMVKNKMPNKNLFIEFWSTNGAGANNIKPGVLLESTTGADIKNKSCMVMTPTMGGRDRLSDEEKLNAFKKHFILRDKIVTQEDIKAFCVDYFGNRISRLEIKKGFDHDLSRISGLRRTIEIHLFPNKELATSIDEWQYLLENLKLRLEGASSQLSRFKIILE